MNQPRSEPLTPQQLILSLAVQLAETTAERDGARAEVGALRDELAARDAAAKADVVE